MEVVVEEIGVLEPFCATDHVPKEKQVKFKLYHLHGNNWLSVGFRIQNAIWSHVVPERRLLCS